MVTIGVRIGNPVPLLESDAVLHAHLVCRSAPVRGGRGIIQSRSPPGGARKRRGCVAAPPSAAFRASLRASRLLAASMPSLSRVLLIDLLRLVAAFQMVEGHTIDAVLSADFRHGGIHRGWLAMRGLTSIAFLFVAGLAFQLSTLRDLERHLRNRAAVAGRFRRAATLVLLGYLLRLPLPAAVFGDSASWADTLRNGAAVDILQCIGVSLALLEGLALALPSAAAVERTSGLLGAAVLALAPQLTRIDPHGPWLLGLDYLSPRAGSLFPLFPWSAHMLLGVALARPLLARPRPWPRLLAAAAVALALSWALGRAGIPLLCDHVGRLGFVLVGAGLLSLLEPAARGWPPWLWRLSGETLVIYVFHVVLVYGRGAGLGALIGRSLGPGAAIALACGMIVLSFAFADFYQRVSAGLARSTATG